MMVKMLDRYFEYAVFTFLVLMLVAALYLCIDNSWVSADAPYFISVGRDISEGKVLYKEVVDQYTPLVSIVFSTVYLFSELPSFNVFVAIQLLTTLLASFILFRLFQSMKIGTAVSGIVSMAFCLSILSCDGNYIVLETYCIVFVLISFFALLRDRGYFFIGILLGCSFLCKQYGVLNFIPFAFYILLRDEKLPSKIRKVLVLGLGGLVVFFFFVAYYTFQGADALELISQISGTGYTQWSVEKERALISTFIGAKVFVIFAFFLVVFAVLERLKTTELLFCWIGMAALLLPVYLQGFQHYYINTFPYLFLGLGIVGNIFLQRERFRQFIVVLFLGTLVCTGLLFSRILRYSSRQQEQLKVAREVEQHAPKGSEVFIHGNSRYLYIVNNYKNPFLSTIGYNYLFHKIDSLITFQQAAVLSEKRLPKHDSIMTKISTKQGDLFLYVPRSSLKK